MPKTRINCPNCRQPIMADIDQLFDVNSDPTAKQRIISGAFNLIQCPVCGYQGNLPTPIVYHDADKELLLTFVPPEIGLPRNEQERLIGGLINQAVSKLPQEKRKAYLLTPQSTLTLQGLVDRVLEAEGITREMIQAQQQRLNLIQRLLNTHSEEARAEIVKQEDKVIDEEFFGLLRRLIEASLMGGDQESARQLSALQESLIPITSFGRDLQAQTKEVEAALKDLQAAGRELSREKLLELVMQAPNETRLQALVSLARPVMDYVFFQLLSERIERARGDGRARLVELRHKLLDLTQQVDQQLENQAQAARQAIEMILNSEDVETAMLQNLQIVDNFFLQVLNQSIEQARKQGDLEKLGKLQQMVEVLDRASEAPPEIALIEELLDAPDDQTCRRILEEHQAEITPEFLSAISSIVAQVDASQDKELAERMRAVNRLVVRFSMEKSLGN